MLLICCYTNKPKAFVFGPFDYTFTLRSQLKMTPAAAATSASPAVTHLSMDHENDLWNTTTTTTTTTGHYSHNNVNSNTTETMTLRQTACGCLDKTFITLDVTFLVATISAILLLLKTTASSTGSHPITLLIALGSYGALLLFRLLSGYGTLAVVLFCNITYLYLDATTAREYCQHFQLHHAQWLFTWMPACVLAVWELLRWQLETMCLYNNNKTDATNDTSMATPLLVAHEPSWRRPQHSSGQTSTRQRGLLARLLLSDATHDTIRDDGSVDFQSVQEEWASRTEEDPYWWSKEDEELPARNANWASLKATNDFVSAANPRHV
jgi:hypothetical protein